MGEQTPLTFKVYQSLGERGEHMIHLFKHQDGFDPDSFIVYAVPNDPDTIADLQALIGDIEPISRRAALEAIKRSPRATFYGDGEAAPRDDREAITQCAEATERLLE